MARVVKEPSVRRNEILEVAQRLVQTRGYEQMAIQDILDELRLSKGAFYHYFDSKQTLLEALVERNLEEVQRLLVPIAEHPSLRALEKLRQYFALIVRWKIERKSLVLELARVWYTDDNAIVRDKVHAVGVNRVAPRLAAIIRQGVEEGDLATDYPDQAGAITLSLVRDLNEVLARLLLAFAPESDDPRPLSTTVAAYTDALERVLGARSGSLQIIDEPSLRDWLLS